MKPEKIAILGVLGIVAGVVAGYAQKTWFNNETSSHQTTGDYLESIPSFTYHDLNGHQRWSTEWTSNILVLNYWATWCPPCRKEIPGFVKLQEEFRKKNVQFVGIAIDDIEDVEEFAEDYKINYPTLLGDLEASELSRKMGNRFNGLPFTVISTPGGKILLSKTGELKEAELRDILTDLIAKK